MPLLILIILLAITGCNKDTVQYKENSNITSQENNNGVSTSSFKGNKLDKDELNKIENLIKNYVIYEVEHNLEKLKKITRETAREELSAISSFNDFDSFTSIDIYPSKNGYHVRVVFQASHKGIDTPTRNQREIFIKKVDGYFYITSVEKTL